MAGDRSADALWTGKRGAAAPASDWIRATAPAAFRPRDRLEAHHRLDPSDPAAPLGRIGRLEASGPARAAELLDQACSELRWRGCTTVLAPLDGDTWHPYRVQEQGQDPAGAFAGEPDPDPRWTDWLAAAGFAVQARYVSSLCTDLQRRRSMTAPLSSFHLVPVESLAIDELLEPIHQLILNGFRRQPLFVPIGLDGFRHHWKSWRGRFDPRLSLLTFDGVELVGLLLAHPDGCQGGRAVVRTLVVQPGRRWAGLGRRLLETCHERAAALGYTAVIHALMHDSGASLALSRPYAQPFRRYVLMGRSLLGEGSWDEAAGASFQVERLEGFAE
jgi:GNAT superfamily N-acetyltransferase